MWKQTVLKISIQGLRLIEEIAEYFMSTIVYTSSQHDNGSGRKSFHPTESKVLQDEESVFHSSVIFPNILMYRSEEYCRTVSKV